MQKKTILLQVRNKIFLNEEQVNLPYGCLMISFELPKWEWFVGKFIDSNDFEPQKWMENKATYDECHTTVLYGFEPNVKLEEIKPLLMKLEDINVEFKSINHFGNEKFDVVKFECESEQLRQMRKVVETLPNKQSYSEYNIHSTIAYVNAGLGSKYDRTFTPFVLNPDAYLFSSNGEPVKRFVI